MTTKFFERIMDLLRSRRTHCAEHDLDYFGDHCPLCHTDIMLQRMLNKKEKGSQK